MNVPYTKYESLLSVKEKLELDQLLKVYNKWPLELEEMWQLMDTVWENLECDNENLNDNQLRLYYTHSVWLLNGLFGESHTESMEHRHSISDWIVNNKIKTLLDYGGGFCSLSRLVAEKFPYITIDVLEPFPTKVSQKIVEQYPQIHFVENLQKTYDCIVALDVLEHVADPLKTLSGMIEATTIGGTLLIGNCFRPVIKCHLPRTFHLHSSFPTIASRMNLQLKGKISGCHVEIYQKTSEKNFNWFLIRSLEMLSKSRNTIKKITKRVR